VPIFSHVGWFPEDLIRRPGAPNGTAEALIVLAMETFRREGQGYLTLGLAPLSGEADSAEHAPPGWIPPWLPPLFRLSYRHANLFYSFRGIRQFREKFRPDRWEPVYLAVSPPLITPAVLIDMLSAFVPGSRLRFVIDTLLRLGRALARRVPAPWLSGIAWAFSLLLIPWMGLLLAVDAERWFGARWLPVAWVSFDAAMAAAFAVLAVSVVRHRRFAWSLSRVMLGAVLADVWLTSAQVGLYNLARATGPMDYLVSGVAILAPLSAALFLTVVALALQPRAPWQERPHEGLEPD